MADIPSQGDVRPYEMLAQVYDYVMRHVDYVEWTDYVERVFAHYSYGPAPKRLLEVACGTGTVALELARRGYEVHGIDRCAEMIGVAKRKAAELEDADGPAPTFSVGDMCALDGSSEVDAVLCLYDSVNYCLTIEDVAAAVRGFRREVREGGLCIFDVTTETNSLRHFKRHRYSERRNDITYTRKSRYDRKRRMQINEFVFTRNDDDAVTREVHEQRIYPVSELLAQVDTDQWYVLGAYDDYSLEPASEDSERVHIVLRARD